MGAEVKPTGKTERGQGLIEFALLIPIMLVLAIGIAEFGRAWMMRNILTGAAREAVRAAAVDWKANACVNAQTIADPILASAGIPPLVCGDVTISPIGAPVPIVSVTTRYTFLPILTGFIPGLSGPINLTGTATMRRERD
ncbi:MAG: TadE family protein [Candidatus Deferrimicrobiaceae bacterium]